MGRKIPGRKHHGVRDPEKQRAERFKKIKDKINTPPTNVDDQQVSKRFQRIAELQAKTKNGDFDKKKKRTKRVIKNPSFQRLPGETDRQFLYRVNRYCNQVKHEAAFTEKFKVDIKRNEKGEVESVEKRGKDPVEVMMKEVRQEQKAKKNAKKKKKKTAEGGEEEVRLSKSQKRKRKLDEKKANKELGKVEDFDKYVDRVKFGEQVHAPPTLTVPKKVEKVVAGGRPGKKDLLLKSMLNKTANNQIDRTGKRKSLPNALRRQLDKQQEEIVQAYRLLKTNKTRNV